MVNSILEIVLGLLLWPLVCLWRMFDRMMEKIWRGMVAASVFLLVLVVCTLTPAPRPALAPAPVATPAPAAPGPIVLYSPNYKGPDVYGVPQNK